MAAVIAASSGTAAGDTNQLATIALATLGGGAAMSWRQMVDGILAAYPQQNQQPPVPFQGQVHWDKGEQDQTRKSNIVWRGSDLETCQAELLDTQRLITEQPKCQICVETLSASNRDDVCRGHESAESQDLRVLAEKAYMAFAGFSGMALPKYTGGPSGQRRNSWAKENTSKGDQ
jgi:hypothetical protein